MPLFGKRRRPASREYNQPWRGTAPRGTPGQRRGSGEIVSAFVCFADIRGFTAFSQHNQTAIPELVTHTLDFLGATLPDDLPCFIKPMGDGAMFVIESDDAECAPELARQLLTFCETAYRGYPDHILRHVHFVSDTPTALGFGLSFGKVHRIETEEFIDYAADVINVAARLQDAARPEGGIVVDESLRVLLGGRLDGYQPIDFALKGLGSRRAYLSASVDPFFVEALDASVSAQLDGLRKAGLRAAWDNQFAPDFRALFAAAREVEIGFVRGRTWFDMHWPLIVEFLKRPDTSLTFVVVDRDSRFIEALAGAYYPDDEAKQRNWAESTAFGAEFLYLRLQTATPANPGRRWTIYTHRVLPAYSFYRFDARLFVQCYKFSTGKQLPVPTFELAPAEGSVATWFAEDIARLFSTHAQVYEGPDNSPG